MHSKSFYKNKFCSMLITGTFTMAVTYIMLLSDNIIAGLFFGESGVSAVNLVTPVTGMVTFLSCIVSEGSGILYSRCIGQMDREGADKIYGQGMPVSLFLACFSVVFLYVFKGLYFELSGTGGKAREYAMIYYRLTPLNAALTVMIQYLSNMVYTDGDEVVTNISYGLQIGGNIVLSIFFCSRFGMIGVILGTVMGNVLGILVLAGHFFSKRNTLRFVFHFKWGDLWQVMRFSAVDSCIYICWGGVDYVLIHHVSRCYGEKALVILAVVISLIEFGVVLDGIGMAIQPLIGMYLGEKNHTSIKRLMKSAIKTAVLEGIFATVLIFLSADHFVRLFGIKDAGIVPVAVFAVRIVCLSLTFCSLVSLATSYYMLVDHISLAVGITIFKDGVLYSVLPVLFSVWLGETGIWIGFSVSAFAALVLAFLYIFFRYGRNEFPWLIENTDERVFVLEDELTKETAVKISEQAAKLLAGKGFCKKSVMWASLFTEEISLVVLEQNASGKQKLLIEISLLFDENAVRLIERDSGQIFDVTDPELQVKGLSSFIIEGLMEAYKEKAYLTTTGYNRNIMWFPASEEEIFEEVSFRRKERAEAEGNI